MLKSPVKIISELNEIALFSSNSNLSIHDHYPVCMTRSEQIIVKKDTHISIVYRNYKKIVESEFLKDLSYAPFNKVFI
jgi:hypothetical protein